MKPIGDAIPAGFRRTEVGLIPEDWDVKPIHTLADKIMVGIASAATHAYRNRGVVMFRNQNIKPGYLDDSDVLYIDEDYEETFRNKRLRAGDLLTARTGYPGTTSIVPVKYEGAQSFTTLITRPRRNAVDSEYLCCFINSEAGQSFFDRNQTGGGQKNVNAGILKHLPVPLPPTKAEQEAIAEALGDADAWIESLEQLVAKKRHLKQAAMQQLLTGRTRLPGFRGEWHAKTLGEIAEVKTGPFGSTLHERDYVEDGTPIITVEHVGEFGVEHSNLPRVTRADKQRLRAYSLDVGDIVFSRVGSVDRNALIRPTEEGWLFSGRLLRVRADRKQAFAPFLSYQFHGEAFKCSVRNVAVGQTMACLNTAILKGLPVLIPTIPEQNGIAEVLDDIDAEVISLEAKLAKARQIKQGMMQELLTGRIRLV